MHLALWTRLSHLNFYDCCFRSAKEPIKTSLAWNRESGVEKTGLKAQAIRTQENWERLTHKTFALLLFHKENPAWSLMSVLKTARTYNTATLCKCLQCEPITGNDARRDQMFCVWRGLTVHGLFRGRLYKG